MNRRHAVAVLATPAMVFGASSPLLAHETATGKPIAVGEPQASR